MIIAVDSGARDNGEAEHVAHIVRDVLGPAWHPVGTGVLSTHLVRTGASGAVVVAVTLDDDGTTDGPKALVASMGERLPVASAMVATWPGSADAVVVGELATGAWSALAQAATRSAGRLVDYPGRSALTGRVAVADMIGHTVVDEVRVVGSLGPPQPDAILDTCDFVRPVWERGRVVLLLQPGPAGTLVPFETEHPHQCCGGH